MIPTPRAVGAFFCSVPAGAIIVSVWPSFWYVSMYWPSICLVLMLFDFLVSMPNKSLDVTVQTPGRLYVGHSGVATVTLSSSKGPRPVTVWSLLEQEGEAEAPVVAPAQLVESEATVQLPLVPHRRGMINLNAIWLRWRGPLGLIEVRRRQTLENKVEVLPDVHGIHEAALQFFSRDIIYGMKTQRLRGDGTEFDALGEYAPGMDLRFIDWKHSARHRKLLCKEFKQERNHHIILAFDTGRLMLEPLNGMPKLDQAIKAGLLLGWVSLYSGDLIGGCGFDARFRNFLKPGRGMPYFIPFQSFTAGLQYRTEETNFTLGLAELHSRLQRRSLVVIFTEFVDTISAELLLESLQLLARKHVVVFVSMRDPLLASTQAKEPETFFNVAEAVVAEDFLRERSVVLERMARMGIYCIDAPASGVSAALLNRYLQVKQQGLL